MRRPFRFAAVVAVAWLAAPALPAGTGFRQPAAQAPTPAKPAKPANAKKAAAAARPPAPNPVAPAKPAAGGDKADASAPALPSMDEIRRLYEARRDPEVLKALSRVINLRGDAAKDYDRHQLWLIKGETHLRMKAAKPALLAFREAAAAAPDDRTRAEAEATALLVKRAKNLVFTPSTKPKAGAGNVGGVGGGIDVLDPEQRRAGFHALFVDELAAAGPKVKAALRGG